MKTKKLSRAMIEHLSFVQRISQSETITIPDQPCFHRENQVTRDALIRRGLIESKNGKIVVTEAGHKALAETKPKQ